MPLFQLAQHLFLTGILAIGAEGQTFSVPVFIAPAAMTITRIESTIGTDGAPAGQPFPAVDAHLSVYVSRPADYLAFFHWVDKYSPDIQPHKDKVFTASDAIHLQAGDQMSLGLYAQTLFGASSHIQVVVIVSYTLD